MSYPNVYQLLNVAGVNAEVGSRIYGFGTAPQNPTYPYITWEIITGVPSNYQGETPKVDKYRVEVNVWGRDQQTVLDAGAAIQSALDSNGHQITQIGPNQDQATQSFRLQLDYSIWTDR